jgi:hypothetical protein
VLADILERERNDIGGLHRSRRAESRIEPSRPRTPDGDWLRPATTGRDLSPQREEEITRESQALPVKCRPAQRMF